jgi:ATP-dependent DNA helicase RecG
MPMEFLMKPTHPSRPRNKIIAQAFFDMGIIERYGSGIKRIKDDCDKNGNPYPEWSDRYGEFATTYHPRVSNDKSNIGLGDSGGNLGGNGGNFGGNGGNFGSNDDTGHTAEIIDSIKQYPSISSAERARLVKVSQRSMERTLRKLKEEGKIRRIGGTRGHWEVLS